MKLIAALFGLVALAYLAMLGLLYTFQRQILFQPDRTRPDPARAGLPDAAIVSIPSTDGIALNAWHLPPADPNGFTVLLLHGNAGHIGHRAERAKRMRAAGWGVLLVDYRSYGGNEGTPTEAGLIADATAGLNWLTAHGVPHNRLLLWGESLGTGIAIRLASQHPVAAVLLEQPYTSIADVAQTKYPLVPARPLVKDKFEALAYVPKIAAPIFVMHGDADRLVPFAMGRAITETGKAELWIAKGAGHVDLSQFGAVEAAADFVRRQSL